MLLLGGLIAVFRVLTLVRDLRLIAEHALSTGRAEAEATRSQMQAGERALSTRLEQARLEAQDNSGRVALLLEGKLREMAEASAARLLAIEHTVGSQLHAAVEQQMTASFGRVLEQFAAVQKAMGEVAAVSAGIGDLKRIFSNVKTRGGWGETQLRALLDDLLPAGSYEANVAIGDGRIVEFAIRMPGQGDLRPLLPIDAKLPLADYERLIEAAEAGDMEAERAARRALEAALRTEARRIASKYIMPPRTTEFAVLYLPTDGLYAEAARMPGLVDDLGRTHRVLLMGPGLLPGLLRTVHLGYVTLSLEQKAEQIGRLLGATRQEMLRMDEVLERLARNAGSMARTIEDARTRTRVMQRTLRDMEGRDIAPAPLDQSLAGVGSSEFVFPASQ
ncbi:DNA recombination protein RmuC [Acidisphaera sp. L21]|uniref:DNA recombination protein RmuC n=1 Tax=Acidisphaera sp. L21 TaxID=1641851 RepID=UPI00131C6B1B